MSHGVRRATHPAGQDDWRREELHSVRAGKAPLDEEGGFESTVLEGGTSQVFDIELTPGTGRSSGFISDKQGGPPHGGQGDDLRDGRRHRAEGIPEVPRLDREKEEVCGCADT